jgi:hypothetical protein
VVDRERKKMLEFSIPSWSKKLRAGAEVIGIGGPTGQSDLVLLVTLALERQKTAFLGSLAANRKPSAK